MDRIASRYGKEKNANSSFDLESFEMSIHCIRLVIMMSLFLKHCDSCLQTNDRRS